MCTVTKVKVCQYAFLRETALSSTKDDLKESKMNPVQFFAFTNNTQLILDHIFHYLSTDDLRCLALVDKANNRVSVTSADLGARWRPSGLGETQYIQGWKS